MDAMSLQVTQPYESSQRRAILPGQNPNSLDSFFMGFCTQHKQKVSQHISTDMWLGLNDRQVSQTKPLHYQIKKVVFFIHQQISLCYWMPKIIVKVEELNKVLKNRKFWNDYFGGGNGSFII